jgi:regulator of protease activity HflC (stomatin/prohibitin superfamily)
MTDVTDYLWVIAVLVFAIFVIVAIAKSIVVVRQTQAYIVERLGRYSRTMDAGLHFLIPFVDKVRHKVDLRELVYSFPPQSVITSDNLVVDIDSVIYFQVTDPKAAVYEIANYITGVEQLTTTTLRNIVGTMDLEQTLTSRDQINGQLRGVLDDATGKWGIRVNRVELKAIEPPMSIKDSMEKQMRAERDRRAAILNAEGIKQSAILTAEGEKQSAILRAEGDAQSQILRAEGEAKAILQVFDAIHEGDADSKLLAYQYLQMLPEIAKTDSNKVWFVPTEFTGALKAVAAGFGYEEGSEPLKASPTRGARKSRITSALEDPRAALEEARRMAEGVTADAEAHGIRSGKPFDPEAEKGQAPPAP